jgi:2-polyprenyl-3-methyl-5-hydroxy-6-metoxy-1,4-benzoquinol methylase
MSFSLLRRHPFYRASPSLPKLAQKLLTLPVPPPFDVSSFSHDDDDDNDDTKREENIMQVSTWINSMLGQQMNRQTSDAVYTSSVLDAYDVCVWDFNSPFLWRIWPEEVQGLYDDCLVHSTKHCEIAVGTGLFLRNLDSHSIANLRQITLLDLNPEALTQCQNRIEDHRYEYKNDVEIDSRVLDIFDPPPAELIGTYDSVGVNFLLHCLHGKNIKEKAIVLRNCGSLLTKDGIMFGSTILGKDIMSEDSTTGGVGKAALTTLRDYNKLGIFGNEGDSYQDLATVLNELFEDVELYRVGFCGVWKVRHPRQ